MVKCKMPPSQSLPTAASKFWPNTAKSSGERDYTFSCIKDFCQRTAKMTVTGTGNALYRQENTLKAGLVQNERKLAVQLDVALTIV